MWIILIWVWFSYGFKDWCNNPPENFFEAFITIIIWPISLPIMFLYVIVERLLPKDVYLEDLFRFNTKLEFDINDCDVKYKIGNFGIYTIKSAPDRKNLTKYVFTGFCGTKKGLIGFLKRRNGG